MADKLKVLMMGGRRAGKTSILAGLVDSMVNGEIKNLLTIEDKTVLMTGQESLAEKINNLKAEVKERQGKVFLVDDSKTNSFTTHLLEFTIPGTSSKMTIEFKDANGEFYESKAQYNTEGGESVTKQEIVDAIKESDIFVIAVDTPYLMEAVNSKNELCSEAVNYAYNHVDDIHSYLTNIDDKDGVDAKLVLFVPIKCEKWVHCGQIDKVSARIEQVYKTMLDALKKYKNVKIDILPIETVGAIEFKEHQTAYICSNNEYVARKCCVINNEEDLRFANGEVRQIADEDIIAEDSESNISEHHSIIRPYSWFHLTGDEYHPHNCEQLAYYILQFVLAKTLFIKEVEEQKKQQQKSGQSLWRLIKTAVIMYFSWPLALVYFVGSKILESLGTISLDELKALVINIESKNLIKHDVEGM